MPVYPSYLLIEDFLLSIYSPVVSAILFGSKARGAALPSPLAMQAQAIAEGYVADLLDTSVEVDAADAVPLVILPMR